MRTPEAGSALVESILLGLVLMVPIMWMLGILSEVHRGALATTAAAREAGAEAARSSDLSDADLSVRRAVELAMVDHGLDAQKAEVRWSSDLGRGGAVAVVVRYPVRAMSLPFLGEVGGPSIWVRARHLAPIDPFGSRDE